MTWFLLCLSLAIASEDGKTGKSITGCKSCHGTTASDTTTANWGISSPIVLAGETISIEFIVGTTNNAHSASGLNVSASAGSLSSGSNTSRVNGEITHASPVDMVGGQTVFLFDWTAPDTNGTVTLFGAANATNNDGRKTGDGWALAEPLELTVEGGESFDTGTDTDTDTSSDTATENPGDTDEEGSNPGSTAEKEDASGCNTSATSVQWYGWLTLLAILGLSRRHTEAARQRVNRVKRPNQQRPRA